MWLLTWKKIEDVLLFHKVVPEADYRFQILHELVVCNVYFNLYVVSTSKIEYAVFVYMPPEIRDTYKLMMADIEKSHLGWLFKNDGSFDTELKNFPKVLDKDISWGYAKDKEGLKSRLQLMMALMRLRDNIKKPLPEAAMLVPSIVSLWNKLKGPIDDFSQVLATVLARLGKNSPMVIIWVRMISLCLYNSWRLQKFITSVLHIQKNELKSYTSWQRRRRKINATFEEYLETVFKNFILPKIFTGEKSVVNRVKIVNIQNNLPLPKLNTLRKDWGKNEDLINYRLHVRDGRHISAKISEIYKRDGRKIPQRCRLFCKLCSFVIITDGKRTSGTYYEHIVPKRTANACFGCNTPLCNKIDKNAKIYTKTCMELWHTQKCIPSRKYICKEVVIKKANTINISTDDSNSDTDTDEDIEVISDKNENQVKSTQSRSTKRSVTVSDRLGKNICSPKKLEKNKLATIVTPSRKKKKLLRSHFFLI